MKKKKDTYRVWAECVSYCYAEIEADSEEEALELAKKMDGGEFINTDDGDWRILENDITIV